MQKYKFIIIRNELDTDHLLWEAACIKFGQSYKVVNLTSNHWLEDIQNEKIDYLLAKPGSISPVFKQLYDERIQVLVNELSLPVFPSLPEILIYENKRFLSYWLKANAIPCPLTWVFYSEKEANEFINNTTFPIVAKLNTGASGSGVTILQNIAQAKNYCHKIFYKGIRPSYGPRFLKGTLLKRIWAKLKSPTLLREKIMRYTLAASNVQKGFALFQEYIHHSFEWRVVRIGDSYFAHKKLLKGYKASGSLLKSYNKPPESLLDFVKSITDKHNFLSQAVDIFEQGDGKYLVNEMQCIFGQSDPYQMLIDEIPGRYIFKDNQWFFDPGDFNTNESYDLRLKTILEILNKNHENKTSD